MIKEVDLPVMYLCIFKKIKDKGRKGVISHRQLRRIFGFVYRVKLPDMDLILKEMEGMGLLRKQSQQMWEVNLKVKDIDMIRNKFYNRITASIGIIKKRSGDKW